MKWEPRMFGFANEDNPHVSRVFDAVQRDIDAGLLPATIEAIFITIFDDGRFTMAYRYSASALDRYRNRWVN